MHPDDRPAPLILGTWPTPIEQAPRLAAALGLGADDLWIKRDDLIGLGGGGNKVRKLQYSCAQALAAGSTTLITTGAAQSNHARLTAAAAARLGMRSVLVLEGQPPAPPLLGNLLLNAVTGATVVWAQARDVPAQVDLAASSVVAAGGVPFVIPFGGSSSYAAQGYVDCARELLDQVPDLRNVVVAVGSGGTMAGLVAGLGADRVIGVHTGAVADPMAIVTGLLTGMPDRSQAGAGLRIATDQVGEGYSSVTAAVRDAIGLAARTEGIFLDPTYTGRAMAGLIAMCADHAIRPGQATVFLHTGGLPGLLAHPELAAAAASA
jgi:L-cysteate sulfo-lyase